MGGAAVEPAAHRGCGSVSLGVSKAMDDNVLVAVSLGAFCMVERSFTLQLV